MRSPLEAESHESPNSIIEARLNFLELLSARVDDLPAPDDFDDQQGSESPLNDFGATLIRWSQQGSHCDPFAPFRRAKLPSGSLFLKS